MPRSLIHAATPELTGGVLRPNPSAVALLGPLLTLGVQACVLEPDPEAFPVLFVATSDREPLAEVLVFADDRPLGKTSPDGELSTVFIGRPGDQRTIRAQCPEGHRLRDEALPLLFFQHRYSLDDATTPVALNYPLRCPPALRRGVVVVRVPMQGAPVLVDGEKVAVTGPHGIAYALVEGPPLAVAEVTVDTRQEPGVKPESPSKSVTLPDRDEIWVFEPQFFGSVKRTVINAKAVEANAAEAGAARTKSGRKAKRRTQ